MGIQESIQRLRARGEAKRKVWMPPPDSVVYRLYNWWRSESGAEIGRENFCHFWRVVLIWAPLLWIRQKLARPVRSFSLQALVALVALAGVEAWAVSGGWWLVPPLVLGAILAVVGFILGCVFNYRVGTDSAVDTVRELLGKSEALSWGAVLVLLTGPAMLVGYAVGHAFCWLFDQDWLEDVLGWVIGIAVIGGVGTILVMLGVEFIPDLGVLLGVLAVVGVVLAFVAVCGVVVGVIAGFVKLLEWGGEAADAISDRIESRKSAAPCKPSLLRRLLSPFRVVWHLLRLVFEAVRVAKWLLICPFVDIPERPALSLEKA